jgi:hypothetical protein
VPQYDYDRGDRGYYDRGYRPYRREPGVSVDVGPPAEFRRPPWTVSLPVR